MSGVRWVGALARGIKPAIPWWRPQRREDPTRTQQRDGLTGLKDREWVLDFLANALRVAGSAGGQVALLLVDLDGLNDINDGFGHDVGDMVLVATASRLEESVGSDEVPARLGGDEFLVVLRGAEAERRAGELAIQLGELLAQPVAVDRHVHQVMVSIGVATAQDGGTGADELIRRAAFAMHQAKLGNGDRVMTFETWMQDEARRRAELAVDLQGVLESGELVLLYQPVVDLERAAVVGAEALVRWQHPTRGLLGPSEFIPLAERDGQILNIGRWVLAEACRHAVGWGWGAPGNEGPFISVNVSARQMSDGDFPAEIDANLRETGLEPKALVLEITESIVMEDTAAVLQRVGELKELGVRIALDDYGTGYSSMSRLMAFPVDVLKIDRIFVTPASRGDPTARALVRSTVSLGEELGMTVIAEGIETPQEAGQMLACGCRYGQGYLLGRPVPAEVFGVLRHARQMDDQHAHPHPPSDHKFG